MESSIIVYVNEESRGRRQRVCRQNRLAPSYFESRGLSSIKRVTDGKPFPYQPELVEHHDVGDWTSLHYATGVVPSSERGRSINLIVNLLQKIGGRPGYGPPLHIKRRIRNRECMEVEHSTILHSRWCEQ